MRTMLLVAAACLLGGTMDAQTAQGRTRIVDEARRAEREANVVRERVFDRVVDDSAMMNRATLGISLGGAAHKRDTLGVFVEAVAENGPAERAGIYEGHRIAFINNIDVRASAADAGDPYLSSVGRHRLVRAMRDVNAGSTVSLRVWTGSGYRDVQVTAGRFADVYENQRVGGMYFDGPGVAFTAPMAGMHMDGPMLRHLELSPSRVRVAEPRNVEIRRAPARGKTPEPVSPSRTYVPGVRATGRVIAAPKIAPAPAPSRVRRFTI